MEETAKEGVGFEKRGISLKDNYSEDGETSNISWDEVLVTDDPKDAEGLVAVKSITKKSGWGGSAGSNLGFKNCVKAIQQETANQGCIMAVITNANNNFGISVTATIYKRP